MARPDRVLPEPARLPRHVAVIMDGNRRWARARGLPPALGHRRGAEAVRRTVEACARLGIRYLTLYAFSSENWRRPPQEVDQLMELLRHYLKSEIDQLHEKDVRIRVIGERAGLAPDIVAMIEEAEERTRGNRRIDVLVALNYGGRQEIVRACRRIVEAVRAGRLEPDALDEERFAAFLDTAGVPDPDLLIRTSGEQRISNFLLWQLAYTELVFLPVLWPDFDEEHLVEALLEYARRERRYGAAAG
ncbi:Ditrans,polycis-undecaprenyl-diphosphate synthase ((2E,6E)-farnesyl-diphosphate specific) [bacterium HR39]|nr:Ditrans,polycis-undecaprenyl-diphosphate synthase ((2E,6E)-farnesyl-diphosphate specific) [bacterium HR39]